MENLSRPHPLLTSRLRQRMPGLRHRGAVGGASVVRGEAGEVDTAGKEAEGEEGTVEGGLTEIVVAGDVSGSSVFADPGADL